MNDEMPMKKMSILAFMALASALQAAVPYAWKVETTLARPVLIDLYRGESIALEATMLNRGVALDVSGTSPQLFWQTNGMGTVYWSVPASATSNVLSAVWAPSNDVGAAYYNCFIGSASGSYRAAFRLRMIAAPGYTPSVLDLPVETLDFSTVTVTNAPYYTTNEVDALLLSTAMASTNYTDEAVAAATNPIPAMITQAVVDAGGVIESITNGLASIAYVDASTPGDYANVSNRAVNARAMTNLVYTAKGLPTATNGGWFVVNGQRLDYNAEVQPGYPAWGNADLNIIFDIDLPDANAYWLNGSAYLQNLSETNFTDTVEIEGTTYAVTGYKADSLALSSDIIAATNAIPAPGNYETVSNRAMTALQSYTETDPTIGNYAAVSNAAMTAGSRIDEIEASTTLIYNLYSSSNALFEVTNYDSQVHIPSARLLSLSSNGTYSVVWDERTNLWANAVAATNYTDAAILAATNRYALRGWSATTSGLGADAPDETTWISTPTTVIAGGLEYQRIATGGEAWLLTSNGMTCSTNGLGYFDISTGDGTPVFRIERTESYLDGVDTTNFTFSGTSVTLVSGAKSTTHPYVTYAPTLRGTWYSEFDGTLPSGMTPTWSGSRGNWQCTFDTTGASGFFQLIVQQEGYTKIINNAVTDLSGGVYYNGTNYVPTVVGNELKFIAE